MSLRAMNGAPEVVAGFDVWATRHPMVVVRFYVCATRPEQVGDSGAPAWLVGVASWSSISRLNE
jgi:hypothetical protein